MRPLERSLPAIVLFMPSYDATGQYGWNSTDILVKTPAKNYTVLDYQELFNDINFTNGYAFWLNGAKIIPNLGAPGVELLCIHVSEISTPGQIVYKNQSEFPDGTAEQVPDNGDGAVNIRSLQGCQRFKNMQTQKFIYKVMPFVSHGGMLFSKDFLNYLQNYLANL